MFKAILVPLDGSPLARQALPYAAGLARAADGRLLLLRGFSVFEVAKDPDAEVRATTELADLTEKLQAEGVAAEAHLHQLYLDEPDRAIVEQARKLGADLIVMATHGRGDLSRWVYGSVADQVLRQAEVPIMLVPAGCSGVWPADRRRRILVPLDGSELALEALGPARELAEQLEAELLLLQIVEGPTYAYAEGYAYVAFDPEAELEEARTYLEAQAAPLRAAGMSVETQALVGYATRSIAETAYQEGIDLIVMASHGRGGLARLVLGSVAVATLQRTGVPLVVVRPAPTRAAEGPRPALGPEAVPAESVAPPAPAAEPTIAVHLTRRELELVERGLDALAYLPGQDPIVGRPAHDLLARLREVERTATEAALSANR